MFRKHNIQNPCREYPLRTKRARRQLALPVIILFFFQSITLTQDNEWNIVNPPTSIETRFGHSMVTLGDGRIALFGGENIGGDLFNDLVTFADSDWSVQISDNQQDSPEARFGHSMAYLSDGRVALFGGENVEGNLMNDLVFFDGDKWVPEVPSNQPPAGRVYHGSCVLEDDRIIVVGGETATDLYSKEIWIYDPTSKDWSRGTDAPVGFQGTATADHNNKVYMLGGWETGRIYYYDVVQDNWDHFTPAGNYPPNQRNYPIVAPFGDKVYFGGGLGYDPNIGGQAIHDDFWIWDFASLSWFQLADFPVPIYKSAAAAVEGNSIHIIVFGGFTSGAVVIENTYEFIHGGLGLENYENIPPGFSLSQNYPNPFNPITVINFSINESGNTRLVLYDLKGAEVAILINERLHKGAYRLSLDGTELPTGIYIYQLKTELNTLSRKMVLVR